MKRGKCTRKVQTENMASEGTSTSSDQDRMEAAVSAVNILAQGKRNMVCGEVPTAVNQFQEACKILAKAYGETAKECADAYFCYGQALLDLARVENGVLGNALQGVPDTDEEESPEQKDEQFEKPELDYEDKEGTEDGGTEEEGEEEGEGEEEEGEETADDTESQEGSQEGDNPDDVSNLQLAWEMLELAKLIYLKDDSKPAKLRAAESHLKLGEVSLETEQYEESLKDLNKCLEIQKELLEPDNRLLAETYYQLGLAYCFNKQFDESVKSYNDAIKVIEDRIANLNKELEKASEEEKASKDFDSPVYKAQKEVGELKEILPDIKAKIEDSEDERKNMDQLKNLAKEALGGSFASGSSDSTATTIPTKEAPKETVQTTDISHLIKRKRKSDDNTEEVVKKVRAEDGSGDATAKVNGTTESPGKKEESKESKDVEMEETKADPKPAEAASVEAAS